MKNTFTFQNLLVSIIIVFGLLASSSVSAQDNEDSKFGFSVSLNSDQFFGYYPFFQGSYELNDGLDFTFYGILWSGGTGGSWGNWTEFGGGVNIEASEGLTINPQIGILGGNLLSSGAAGESVFADGIVPNVTVGLDKSNVEGQIYAGFYAPLRDEAATGGTTLSYLHYWINGGYKVSNFFSFGAHYEHLINTGGSNVDESTDVYQWVGPYVQFSRPSGGIFARFSFGADVVENNDSFFKLTAGYSF